MGASPLSVLGVLWFVGEPQGERRKISSGTSWRHHPFGSAENVPEESQRERIGSHCTRRKRKKNPRRLHVPRLGKETSARRRKHGERKGRGKETGAFLFLRRLLPIPILRFTSEPKRALLFVSSYQFFTYFLKSCTFNSSDYVWTTCRKYYHLHIKWLTC